MPTEFVSINSIKISADYKKPDRINQLATSIERFGLKERIFITEDGELVDGYRRLEAYKRLDWKEVPVIRFAHGDPIIELVKIDRKFAHRDKLSTLEVCDLLKMRKEVYESLSLAAKSSMCKNAPKIRSLSNGLEKIVVPSFAANTASKFKIAKSTIEENVRIATRLVPAVKRLIYRTPLANSKKKLIYLSQQAPDKQIEVANKFISGHLEWPQKQSVFWIKSGLKRLLKIGSFGSKLRRKAG